MIAITGETGTGKSLISSAFSLAAGARVRGGDLVGSNGPTARVQLELELAKEHVKTTSDVRGSFTVVVVLSSSLEGRGRLQPFENLSCDRFFEAPVSYESITRCTSRATPNTLLAPVHTKVFPVVRP